MFTRIGKGILTFGMIVGFITSIVLGVRLGKIAHSDWFGFCVFLFGVALTLVISTGLGVILEIATNIEVIRKEAENRQIYPVQAISNTSTSKSTDNSYNLIEMYNNRWNCLFCGHQNAGDATYCVKCGKLKSDSPTPETDFWICRHCGTKNKMVNRYCKSCRQDKIATPHPANTPRTPQDDDWKCPSCGEANSVFDYICKKCGKSKY